MNFPGRSAFCSAFVYCVEHIQLCSLVLGLIKSILAPRNVRHLCMVIFRKLLYMPVRIFPPLIECSFVPH